MVAHTLKKCFADEIVINTDSLISAEYLLNKGPRYEEERAKGIILQAPSLLKEIHLLETPVIMMIRDIRDIQASMSRTEWQWDHWGVQCRKYGVDDPLNLPEKKYELWNNVIKHKLTDYYELEYESLSSHELWVPKEKRKYFEAAQVTV